MYCEIFWDLGGDSLTKCKIDHHNPTLEEYKYLCESVGWTNYMNFEVVETSLRNSIHCVTVKDNEQIVGMGLFISISKI